MHSAFLALSRRIVSKYKRLKKPVYAVFVDFRKAFDSVSHDLILIKLRDQFVDWVQEKLSAKKSYLQLLSTASPEASLPYRIESIIIWHVLSPKNDLEDYPISTFKICWGQKILKYLKITGKWKVQKSLVYWS